MELARRSVSYMSDGDKGPEGQHTPAKESSADLDGGSVEGGADDGSDVEMELKENDVPDHVVLEPLR